MSRMKIKDIAVQKNERVDNPSHSPYSIFVGLEHYDSGEATIRRFGSTERLESAMKVFHAGDMLVARRNVYLKRAATVSFDGLTSGDSIVLHIADEEIRRIIPFVLNSDDFWNYANRHADGSMSKRLSPKLLMEYEFSIPDDNLHQAAEILWAMERVKNAYRELIARTDDLVKSQFIEMFGDPVDNEQNWPTYRFSDVAVSRLGKMLDKRKQTGLYQRRYLANANVQWFTFDLQNLNQMDFDEADQKEFELRDGDLLVCEGGEIGRCAIWHGEISDCYFQKAIHRVRCNTDILLPEYLGHSFFYHSQKNGFSDIVSSKSTIAHLPGDKLKAMNIIVPPLELQKMFTAILEQSDKSKKLASKIAEAISIEENIIGGMNCAWNFHRTECRRYGYPCG